MLGLAILLGLSRADAFTSQGTIALSASVSLNGTGTPALTIIALPLAPQVFSGKHFVVPVEVISSSSGNDSDGSDLQIDAGVSTF